MYRMIGKWEISYRRKTTKVPQNTRHSEDIKTRFIRYVKFRMNLIGVDFEDVYNVDQTNLPFSMEAVYTWAQQNSESVAVKGSKTDGRATVMLGTNATGTKKLPPFPIFKGTQNGWIAREVRQKVGYPPDVQLGMQDKAWMNEDLIRSGDHMLKEEWSNGVPVT
jgi:DDE superfamily endonuclease